MPAWFSLNLVAFPLWLYDATLQFNPCPALPRHCGNPLQTLLMRCQHCGKLTVVRTAGKGNEFTHRCPHCSGYHKFTMAGHHGSGAINYRVTKVEAAPGKVRPAGLQPVRSTTGGSQ